MTVKPHVSLVMSVFNSGEPLRESVQALISGEGIDFVFIAVNDGSIDTSVSMPDECVATDAMDRGLRRDNQGLTRALIRGCTAARGQYIAARSRGSVVPASVVSH